MSIQISGNGTITGVSSVKTVPSSDMSYTPAGTGAVPTMVQTKLRESVSVKDQGGTTEIDCAAALIAAGSVTTGTILFPAGAWVATATPSNSALLLNLLNRVRCDGTLTINLESGTHSFISQVVVNSPDAQRIQILGAATVGTTATTTILLPV